MSTRSRIGILNSNGTVTSIYCHHDGYLSGVGSTLLECYTTEEKVRALLALGDISVLDNDTDSTIAYARNRGETGIDARTDPWVGALISKTEEYTYVFNPVTFQWFYDEHGNNGVPLPRLTQTVIEEE